MMMPLWLATSSVALTPSPELKTTTSAASVTVPADLNTAGLEVALDPPGGATVGQKLKFRLSTHQAGYAIILDVNAEGVVTQIYPNVFSLKLPARARATADDPCVDRGANTLSSFGLAVGADQSSNRLEANQVFELPGPSGRANYTMRACPPTGSGFVFAILSDRPLQMVDLPDLPAELVGTQGGVDQMIRDLRSLRIVSSDAPDPNATAHRWSISVTGYTISAR